MPVVRFEGETVSCCNCDRKFFSKDARTAKKLMSLNNKQVHNVITKNVSVRVDREKIFGTQLTDAELSVLLQRTTDLIA